MKATKYCTAEEEELFHKAKQDFRCVRDIIYAHYRELFEKTALCEFRKHPFDFRLNLEPKKIREQEIFATAVEAFVRACTTYNPQKTMFSTWLSRTIGWHFAELRNDNVKKNPCMTEKISSKCLWGGDSLKSNGKTSYGKDFSVYTNEEMVLFRKFEVCEDAEKLKEEFEMGGSDEPDRQAAAEEAVAALINSLPKDSSSRRTIVGLHDALSTYADSESDYARVSKKTPQAISKCCLKVRSRLPERVRQQCVEVLAG